MRFLVISLVVLFFGCVNQETVVRDVELTPEVLNDSDCYTPKNEQIPCMYLKPAVEAPADPMECMNIKTRKPMPCKDAVDEL